MQSLEQLQNLCGSESISIDENSGDYPIIVIHNDDAEARIALHGAHVLSYIPQRQQPVIFTSQEAIYREGKAIRGGIPLCWPWFGAHPSESSQPSHGHARTAFWRLEKADSDGDISTLTLSFGHGDLAAVVTISVGVSLEVSLTTTNTGSETSTIGGALHSYFQVSHIENVSLTGLDNIHYTDTLTDTAEVQQGEIKIDEEIDNIYHDSTDTITLYDKQWNRSIVVEKTGSLSSVVWNPWIKKSQSMADLGDDEYLNFVCIEAANAATDTYLLEPGESHTLSTTITSV